MEQVIGQERQKYRQSKQMGLNCLSFSRSCDPSLPVNNLTNVIQCKQVTQHETGKAMVSGEFVSMTTLHETLPYLTPLPVAWGTYAADTDVHFFLCGFVEMTDDLPDVQSLAASLAELHKKGLSPNGKYGFSVPTLQGTVPQYTEWTDSWEEFFTNSLRKVIDNEVRSQGPDEEVEKLYEGTLNKVVPRLLRPLETGGRSIQPRLVHGDIWDGNVSTDITTNTPVIYDATCIYAHNESKPLVVLLSGKAELYSRTCSFAASPSQDGKSIRKGVFQAFPHLRSRRRPGR